MTDAELKAALAAAPAGSTFTVPAGSYGYLKLVNLKPNLTVRFAPGAVANALDFAFCHGLRLQGARIRFTPNAATPGLVLGLRIVESKNVLVDGARIDGLPSPYGVEPDAPAGAQAKTQGAVRGLPHGTALNAYRAPGLVVRECVITGFFRGVAISNSADVVIERNYIHETRSTPIAFADADRIRIDRNRLGPMRPWKLGGPGDHGDMIHGWIDHNDQIVGGVKRPTVGVTITRNLWDQGDGAAPLGIYLDDNALGVGFVDVVIEENTILNGDPQGMRLEYVGGRVRGNVLLAPGRGHPPSIVVHDPRDRVLAIEGNTLFDREISTKDRRRLSAAYPRNTYLRKADVAMVDAARAAALARIGKGRASWGGGLGEVAASLMGAQAVLETPGTRRAALAMLLSQAGSLPGLRAL